MLAGNLKPTLLDSALALRDKGLSVIPLEAKGKRPAVKWEAYQSAPASLEEIKHWFGYGVERNVGIVTGAVSGVVVLDVDDVDLLATIEDLPKTPTVKTGKGYHYYFKHPGRKIGNFELPCGDFRGDGGQVVAPPSLHPNGRTYEWIVGLNEPLADLPDWVLKYEKPIAAAPANDNGQTSKYGAAWFKDVEALGDKQEPGRNNLLNKTACRAGSLIASDHLSESEARAAMLEACKLNGLLSDDGLAQVLATINSGITEGKHNPRYPLDPLTTEAVYTGGRLVIVKASEIKEEKVSWLWPGVLARRKFSLIVGDQGLGKSQVTCSIAAIVSNGGQWPASKERAERGSVVIFSMEDDSADTIKPRLRAAGADVDKVHVVKMAVDDKGQRPVSLKCDMAEIKTAVEAIGNVGLIIIDPVTAYLGDANNNDMGDVRGITTELSALAQDHNLCVLAVSHLNKKQDQSAAYRVAGSGAWTQAARTVFLVERDSEDHEKRSMTPLKNNAAPDTTGFAFTIQSVTLSDTGVETSKVVWEAYALNKTAAQALAERNDGGAVAEAKEFLLTTLRDGPVLHNTIKADATALDISWASVRRAKDQLHIDPWKEKKPKGRWFWSLPTSEGAQDKEDEDAQEYPEIDFD